MSAVAPRPTVVLLVDGDHQRARTLARELEEGLGDRGPALRLEHASELQTALERLSRGGVDVVLLDIVLPDSQGLVTFEQAYAFAPDVPFVVFTDVDDETTAVAAVQAGAQDYLVRSEIDARGLLRSIRYSIERHRLLMALKSLSLIDDLTGLYNRRGFMELGTQFLKLLRRSGRGATLLYLDLDRFKRINDAHGHHVGDRALIHVAEILRAAFRRSDLIARVGGDEFAVLAPATSSEPAEMLDRRVREGLASFNNSAVDAYRLDASLGLARAEPGERFRLEDVLAAADAAMYEEKRTKRKVVAR